MYIHQGLSIMQYFYTCCRGSNTTCVFSRASLEFDVAACLHYLATGHKFQLNTQPSLKIRTANAIRWNYLGLFRDYGLDHIFLGIKLFRFSRQNAETFSICLKKNFVKPRKFQLIQLIQTIFISIFSIGCLIELKFCKVSFFFKQMLKI